MGGRVVVQELQHVAQLNGPFQHLLLRQKTGHLAEHGFQIAPFNKLHDQIRARFFAEIVIHFGNGRMTQGRQNVGFALEVLDRHLPHLRIERMAFHLFDSAQLDDVGEPLIARLINRAHAAQAQNAENFVTILQDAARRQGTLDAADWHVFTGSYLAGIKTHRIQPSGRVGWKSAKTNGPL